MATATLINPARAVDSGKEPEHRARILRLILRNMGDKHWPRERRNVVVPIRTKNHPSPMKQAASNRQPGQSHTRTTVDEAIDQELTKARILMHDLADHVLGHLVSTDLAMEILTKFIEDGIVQVFEGVAPRGKALDPNSDDVDSAVQQAFEDAEKHNCIPEDMESNGLQAESLSTDTKGKGKKTGSKRKGIQKQKTYSFKWSKFPGEPIKEGELVKFLNDITDGALELAEDRLTIVAPLKRHQFAAPVDKHHATPLSYEPDGEDMRPDFILLPMEAFKDDHKTVDPKYVNFTASRLVGEAKNKNLAASLEQVQRYARGLRRAQPWVHYVLAMTITKNKAVFLRGEGSGTERLEMILSDGRGCIEFIRILLGLALADQIDLGHNPDVELRHEVRMCEVKKKATPGSEPSIVPVSSRTHKASSASKVVPRSSRSRSASAASNAFPSASKSASVSLLQQAVTVTSRSSKRVHSEIGDGDAEGVQSKRQKIDEPVLTKEEQVVFYPLKVYGYHCLGILFTSSSIRGRGTTVFCVVDLKNRETLLALKMSWQDIERLPDQDAVVDILKANPHPNVIVPIETLKPRRDGKECTTLGAIRGFSDDQIARLHIENRLLCVSISELKRPVKYFWSVHDFVRGLRGALRGHEYLTKIDILHRDISENNIVLELRPGQEGGYLIDFDMAIVQKAEPPTTPTPSEPKRKNAYRSVSTDRDSSPIQPDETEPTKGLRTGTFPYISYNVLWGEKHTQFDDVESFLYVLFFFFFSYAGPLSHTELLAADENGFVRSTGSGKLSHMRKWPEKYARWADGDAQDIARLKHSTITDKAGAKSIVRSAEFDDCLKHNWPKGMHQPIRRLVKAAFTLFRDSTLCTGDKRSRTEVSHADFIELLDDWLKDHSDLEPQFSNCPKFDEVCRRELH